MKEHPSLFSAEMVWTIEFRKITSCSQLGKEPAMVSGEEVVSNG